MQIIQYQKDKDISQIQVLNHCFSFLQSVKSKWVYIQQQQLISNQKMSFHILMKVKHAEHRVQHISLAFDLFLYREAEHFLT